MITIICISFFSFFVCFFSLLPFYFFFLSFQVVFALFLYVFTHEFLFSSKEAPVRGSLLHICYSTVFLSAGICLIVLGPPWTESVVRKWGRKNIKYWGFSSGLARSCSKPFSLGLGNFATNYSLLLMPLCTVCLGAKACCLDKCRVELTKIPYLNNETVALWFSVVSVLDFLCTI